MISNLMVLHVSFRRVQWLLSSMDFSFNLSDYPLVYSHIFRSDLIQGADVSWAPMWIEIQDNFST